MMSAVVADHKAILREALQRCLGAPTEGALVYTRCLPGEMIRDLLAEPSFLLGDWEVLGVLGSVDPHNLRLVEAHTAMERREDKNRATLLLVDVETAGAGMDGIYSAGREISEGVLFDGAIKAARKQLSKQQRDHAIDAEKVARRTGRRHQVAPRQHFNFLIGALDAKGQVGPQLWRLGLWPIIEDLEEFDLALEKSKRLTEGLILNAGGGQTQAARFDALRLRNLTDQQRQMLDDVMRSAVSLPPASCFAKLSSSTDIWIGRLSFDEASEGVSAMKILPWRQRNGKPAAWSGLTKQDDETETPVLLLPPSESSGDQVAKLEVRWEVKPADLPAGSAVYRVAVVTGEGEAREDLVVRDEVVHRGRGTHEVIRFSNEDFAALPEGSVFSAAVVVSCPGNPHIPDEVSEEFEIRFGEIPPKDKASGFQRVRAVVEGLIGIETVEQATDFLKSGPAAQDDGKGFVLLKPPAPAKSLRTFRPKLVKDAETDWQLREPAIGRWRVRVRQDGSRAQELEWVPMDGLEGVSDKLRKATRDFARDLASQGGLVGRVLARETKAFDNADEYVKAWIKSFEEGADPMGALCQTVEVLSLSGRQIGLIVLPSHPLRVAWHCGYDNLVLHARYESNLPKNRILKEFTKLEGAHFPEILPGLKSGEAFVFSDLLGFHTVAMTRSDDGEPKATVALLARCLSEGAEEEAAPAASKHTASVLGREIKKYLESHQTGRFLHIHALRPGDGLTVARALGHAVEFPETEEESQGALSESGRAFVLELYPSESQQGISGRFLLDTIRKRRSGSAIAEEDRWMSETVSLSAGVAVPRLRWARRDRQEPERSAHLAIAFDTFDTYVVCESRSGLARTQPLHGFGLVSVPVRSYSAQPNPVWRRYLPLEYEGEKHLTHPLLTDRLIKLQTVISRLVVRHLGGNEEQDWPVLTTVIPPDKEESLRTLHRLSDWVVTIDRNAGIEYFDSPQDGPGVYESYVIDCVPEREDFGCLQLVTSTANLDEVRGLLDDVLRKMGLSSSHRQARFLLARLKALSGRLAIRVSGQLATSCSEMVALALVQSACERAEAEDEIWPSLKNGFFVPLDDVRDLLSLQQEEGDGQEPRQELRADLLHVSLTGQRTGGLKFRFVEVKYRRHLRTARNPELMETIANQVLVGRRRFDDLFFENELKPSLRALRRSRLARVLRFYAEKALRHHLPQETFAKLIREIDRLVHDPKHENLNIAQGGQGFVFCPEMRGGTPVELACIEDVRVYLFGPDPALFLPPRSDVSVAPEAAPERVEPPAQGTAADEEPAVPQQSMASESSGPEPVATELTVPIGTDLMTGADISWKVSIKSNPHLMVVGLPGMGKTNLLVNTCHHLVKGGVTPIVFSFHQDMDERLLEKGLKVEFSDFDGLGYNPLEVLDRTLPYGHLDVVGAVKEIFSAVFTDLGDVQNGYLRDSLKESFRELGWDDRSRDRESLTVPSFRRFFEILTAHPKPDRSRQNLIQRLGELDDYGFFLQNSNSSASSVWQTEGGVRVLRLHRTPNEVLQRALASLVFYGIYKDMFRRGIQDRITHAVLFDEAHRASKLALIPRMAKECRKYGIMLLLASQGVRDFDEALFSGVANYIALRCIHEDARALVRTVARSDQEKQLIDKLKEMPKYRALFFSEGAGVPNRVQLAP